MGNTIVMQPWDMLDQDESATLEFKREWHKLNGGGDSQRWQKAELIKDVLAMANGDAYSAGQTAYLIVGVGDERTPDGSRELFDVGDSIPQAASILQMVNAVSSPPLQGLEVIPFEAKGKRLFALRISPSPYLHETSRLLETPSKTFSERIVFIRRNETVAIASASERDVIRQLKGLYFSETQNVPPIAFGAVVGAAVGGITIGRLMGKQTGKKEGAIAGTIVGLLVGGILGGSLGSSYRSLKEIKLTWRQIYLWHGWKSARHDNKPGASVHV